MLRLLRLDRRRGELYIRGSDLEKFAKRLGMAVEQLASALGARAVKMGSGVRYVVDLESLGDLISALLGRVAELERRVDELALAVGELRRAAQPGDDEFESLLRWAIQRAAGPTGYAPLSEVKRLVQGVYQVSDEEFNARIARLARTGRYVLAPGGEYRVVIGGVEYGFIKMVR